MSQSVDKRYRRLRPLRAARTAESAGRCPRRIKLPAPIPRSPPAAASAEDAGLCQSSFTCAIDQVACRRSRARGRPACRYLRPRAAQRISSFLLGNAAAVLRAGARQHFDPPASPATPCPHCAARLWSLARWSSRRPARDCRLPGIDHRSMVKVSRSTAARSRACRYEAGAPHGPCGMPWPQNFAHHRVDVHSRRVAGWRPRIAKGAPGRSGG